MVLRFLRSLRGRLLLLVLMAILPAMGLVLADALTELQQEREEGREQVLQLARLAVRHHNQSFEGTRLLLMALARLPEVRYDNRLACNPRFAVLLKEYPLYVNLGVADLEGNLYCSALPLTQPVNVADRAWFQWALSSRGFAAGDYQTGPITGKATINFGYPVIGAAGNPEGVVFAAMSLVWLNQLAANAGLPDEMTLSVVDLKGTVLARHPDPDQWIGRSIPDRRVLDAIRAQEAEGTVEGVGLDGVPHLHAFSRLTEAKEATLYLTVGLPRSVAYVQAAGEVTELVILLGVAVIVTAGAWLWSKKYILRFTDRLSVTTRELAAGHLDARTGLPHDAGELGHLALEIDEMARSLEVGAAERARAEENRLARQAADQANRAKSEFISRMSHELRTPLNAILGFAQLLEMESLSPDQADSVAHIRKGGNHLLELINEVLDIARIEAGRFSISPEPVSIGEVIQESLSLIRPLAAQEQVRLNAAAEAPPERYVLADRQRLTQVLLNLLSNAVKYNHKGGEVEVSSEEAGNGRVRLTVRDTGPGIAPDRQRRLFTPFERLEADGSGIEGSGLGLALSKRLVEAMGGAMGLQSEVGRGSTFWVDLPLVQVDEAGAANGGPSTMEVQKSPPSRLVLLIEDNLSSLKLIQRVLADRPDVRVMPAMQGRLGLDLALEHHPTLILLDLHLPDMPGEELLLRLRASSETRRTPVAVISAMNRAGEAERLLSAGAQLYLTKPLDVKRFLAFMDGVLAAAPGPALAPAASEDG